MCFLDYYKLYYYYYFIVKLKMQSVSLTVTPDCTGVRQWEVGNAIDSLLAGTGESQSKISKQREEISQV